MQNNWLYRILNYKTPPPEGVWKTIANSIKKGKENNLGSKMTAYEVTPPETAFSNIFTQLYKEENELPGSTVAERMYHYTEAAPDNTWQLITAELDKKESIIISLKNTHRVIYSIAAAAVVITLVFLALLVNTKKTAPGNLPLANNAPGNKQVKTTPEKNNITINLPVVETPQTNKQQTGKKVKQTTHQLPLYPGGSNEYVQINKVADLAPNPATTYKKMLQNKKGETPLDISLIPAPNTYISITGPDGQSVKVSSKFSDMIGLLKNQNPETEENLDIIIKESAKWKATFAKWRKKMTNNVIAPSLGNFMDIIELSKVLEDKNR